MAQCNAKVERPVRVGHKRIDTQFLWVDSVAGSELEKQDIGSYMILMDNREDAWGFLKEYHIRFPLSVTFLGTQVYGNQSEDEMGTVGYFPSNLVQEQHVYQEATKEVPTTVSVSGAGERGEKDSEYRRRQV